MSSIVVKDDMARPAASAMVPAGGMRVRVLSALVLAIPALLAVHLGSPIFDLLLIAIAVLMALEWDRLCAGPGRAGQSPRADTGGASHDIATWTSVGLVICATVIAAFGWYAPGLLFAAIGFAATYLIARGVRRRAPLLTALGVLYIAVPVLALLALRDDAEFGRLTVYWLLGLVWATDTGALLVGRAVGGPKLAPRISPNKTWAGLIGGILSATLVGLVMAWLSETSSVVLVVLASAVLAVVAQLGDLAESAVKRHFEVKDSGGIIPGHGGLFDRLDGLLAVAPVVAFALLVAGDGGALWQ